jgi:Undecaprenyl-phosphate galactose phosphotransferase WbaP
MIRIFREFVCTGLMMLTDAFAFILALFLGYGLRAVVLPLAFRFPLDPIPLRNHLESAVPVGLVIILLVFSVHRLYTDRFRFWETTRRLLKAATMSFVLLAAFVFLSRFYVRYSRVSLVLAWGLSLILFPLLRSTARGYLTKRRLCRENVLILGRAATAGQSARDIRSHPELGYRVVGFLGPEEDESRENPEAGHRISGGVDDLETVCRNEGVHRIIINALDFPRKEFAGLIKRCELLAETIEIVPMTDGLYSMGAEIESREVQTIISIKSALLRPGNLVIKEGLSLILALFFCAVLAPFLLIIAAAILFDSRGPVFYSQDRLGKGERLFKIFKFRSMCADAEKQLDSLLEQDPAARTEWKEFQKIRGKDPRVTRVGRFLRKWSLDELPQLFNVLRGDMSLIGPRPYLPRERERIRERGCLIFRIKPGITGLWQVRGRNLLSFDDRLDLDEYYIRNWSLWLDTVILLKTVKALLRREGAF